MAGYFLDAPEESIKKTFEATTQFAISGWITGHIYNTFKSPFPALNVIRRNEAVATDTVFSDTPSICGGFQAAQFFTGLDTKFCDIIGLRNDSDFVNTLMDLIRKIGAMNMLVSDRAQVEISSKVKDVFRHLFIKEWQSEPHYQNQNFAERIYQIVKTNCNKVLNSTNAPPNTWFLCLEYVCFVMYRMAWESLGWRTPYEKLKGSTPDISMTYRFRFWDLLYYTALEGDFNFQNTPLAPPGCKVLVHQKPIQRASWSPHAVDGWYVGPAVEHHQCYKVYLTSTRSERITYTLRFLPHLFTW